MKGRPGHKLRLGDRVYHGRRNQYGTYGGLANGLTDVWVLFDGEVDSVKVSRDQLSKVAS